MMYNEFCELLGDGWTISMDDYKLIEYVYTWSPLIPDFLGKKRIVELFEFGGMQLIRQLVPACKIAETKEKLSKRCEKAHEICDKYQNIAAALDELSEDSDAYWKKASEFIDEQVDCINKMDEMDKEFEIV